MALKLRKSPKIGSVSPGKEGHFRWKEQHVPRASGKRMHTGHLYKQSNNKSEGSTEDKEIPPEMPRRQGKIRFWATQFRYAIYFQPCLSITVGGHPITVDCVYFYLLYHFCIRSKPSYVNKHHQWDRAKPVMHSLCKDSSHLLNFGSLLLELTAEVFLLFKKKQKIPILSSYFTF